MNGTCVTCAKHDTCFYSSEKILDCTRYEPKPETNYEKLFGTPERAARTLVERLDVCAIEWCNDDCENCPYERGPYGCEQVLTLLEWLESEVRDD